LSATALNSFGSVAYFRAPAWVTLITDKKFSFVNPEYKKKTVQQIVDARVINKEFDEAAKQNALKTETSLKLAADLTEKYYWAAVSRLRKLSVTMPLTLNFCPAQQVLVDLDMTLTGVVAGVMHSIDANNNKMNTSLSLVFANKIAKEDKDYYKMIKHPIYDNADAFAGRNLVLDGEEYDE
jgi:hypothetical protein